MDPKRAKRLIANRQVGLQHQQPLLILHSCSATWRPLVVICHQIGFQSPVTASWHHHILACTSHHSSAKMLVNHPCTALRPTGQTGLLVWDDVIAEKHRSVLT